MFKTHSSLTKESGIAIGVILGMLLMAVMTVITLLPGILGLTKVEYFQAGQNPIDQETVKQAIKVIGE
jgi:hypothetical protein